MLRCAEIGPYVIRSTLGSGSTGKVKLAEHKETGKKVAIKIIKKKLFEEQPELKTKIQREISLMKLFDNRHLLRLVDVLESSGHLYIVLEYAEHGELFDYLVERGSLSVEQGMEFFRQIIYGLEFLHSHAICHRDLKPENILLDQHDTIKIADFGFARWMKESIAETSCGSPHYASPEVIKGDPYDGRKSDIWSAGVILYTLLCGNLPFEDSSIRGLLLKVKSGVYRMPDFPDDIKDLISNMLQVDPAKRFTIADIKAHEAFRRDLPPLYVPPAPLPIPTLTDPMSADEDTISALHQLGFEDNDEVERELESSSHNMVKAFAFMIANKQSFDDLPWDLTEGAEIVDSMNGLELTYQGEDPMFGAYGLVSLSGSEPFYRRSKSYQLSLNSLEQYSIIERSLISEEAPTYACNNTQEIQTVLPLELLMTAVQDFLNIEHFAWFYPDEAKIMARKKDHSMDILIQAEQDLMGQLTLMISLPKGDRNEFDDVVLRLQTMIEGVVPM